MLKLTRTLNDPNGIVSKLIFEDKKAIAEAVAYRYERRGVICLSVQSGCPIGCKFCGTGNKFIRSLTTEEILLQIEKGLKVIGYREKTQIMTMSMGEPMMNWKAVEDVAVHIMNTTPWHFYISTVGVDDPITLAGLVKLGKLYPHFGLQFSLHHWHEPTRKELLGNWFGLLPLDQIFQFGRFWTQYTGKKCYFNYICHGNETSTDALQVATKVSGMHLTCSVLCNTSGAIKTNPAAAIRFAEMVRNCEANGDIEISVFDPAGQDTIGGGCGQLLYVQERLRK